MTFTFTVLLVPMIRIILHINMYILIKTYSNLYISIYMNLTNRGFREVICLIIRDWEVNSLLYINT
jgi:hypothetical protein